MGGACSKYAVEMHTWFWWGNLRETYHLDDPVTDGRIILKQIFSKWDGGHGLGCSGSEKGQVAGTCKHANVPLGSKQCANILTS
jgi:hypothetical protein